MEGSIQTRSYDAQDGTKRYVTALVADNVEFLSSREDGGSRPGNFAPASPAPAPRNAAPASSDFTEVDDDELPF